MEKNTVRYTKDDNEDYYVVFMSKKSFQGDMRSAHIADYVLRVSDKQAQIIKDRAGNTDFKATFQEIADKDMVKSTSMFGED